MLLPHSIRIHTNEFFYFLRLHSSSTLLGFLPNNDFPFASCMRWCLHDTSSITWLIKINCQFVHLFKPSRDTNLSFSTHTLTHIHDNYFKPQIITISLRWAVHIFLSYSYILFMPFFSFHTLRNTSGLSRLLTSSTWVRWQWTDVFISRQLCTIHFTYCHKIWSRYTSSLSSWHMSFISHYLFIKTIRLRQVSQVWLCIRGTSILDKSTFSVCLSSSSSVMCQWLKNLKHIYMRCLFDNVIMCMLIYCSGLIKENTADWD